MVIFYSEGRDGRGAHHGIVSIPWLIIHAVILFALMESAARKQRATPLGW